LFRKTICAAAICGGFFGAAGAAPMPSGPVLPTPTTPGFVLRHTLDNPLASMSNGFGSQVATDGTYALIGAPLDTANQNQQGSAALFDVATGALLHSLTSPTSSASVRFGSGVALAGGEALIGSSHDGSGPIPSFAGRAFVYDSATGALKQSFQSTAPASGGNFGAAVALSETGDVFVGEPGATVGGATDAGRALSFPESITQPIREFANPAPRPFGGLGGALAYDDGLLLASEAGTLGGFVQGSAHLFNAGTGALLRTLADPDPGAPSLMNENLFGAALALGGDYAVVGDPGDDVNGLNAGAVVVFNKINGAVVRTFQSPDLQTYDGFGRAVATDGTILAVGEPGHGPDPNGFFTLGQVHIFDILSGNLLQTIANPDPAVFKNGSFGAALAFAGDALVIGSSALNARISAGPNSVYIPSSGGRAFIYSRYDLTPGPMTPVPVPASAALYIGALALCGALVRRRR
jgi:hypothetical protein